MTAHKGDIARYLSRNLRSLPTAGTEIDRAERLRRLLEECGVHCDESLRLDGLSAVVLASERGTEALVAAGLSGDRRLDAYARIVARLLLDEPAGAVDARFEYTGPLPSHALPAERSTQVLVNGLAAALAGGDIARAPRALYLKDEPDPAHVGAAIQRVLDRCSLALYRRSALYRRIRARSDVAAAVGRVRDALTGPQPIAA